eukprot:Hpha_TRINITY_DN26732_c0_g1::TRINITY_DN26732_c0_g1_i1::g.138778::m.138778/K12471/EPN; epsin
MASMLGAIKSTVLRQTPIQQKVHAATNDDPWGPHGQDMQEIAEASFNYQDKKQIMQILLKKLDIPAGKTWRQTYKSMILLEYLAVRGQRNIVEDVRDQLYTLRMLSNEYKHKDEKGVDHGQSVRERARKLAELVTSEQNLQTERDRAAATRSAIGGGGSRPSGYGGRSDKDRDRERSKYGGFSSSDYDDKYDSWSPSEGRLGGDSRQEQERQDRAYALQLQAAEEVRAGRPASSYTRSPQSAPAPAPAPVPAPAPAPPAVPPPPATQAVATAFGAQPPAPRQ